MLEILQSTRKRAFSSLNRIKVISDLIDNVVVILKIAPLQRNIRKFNLSRSLSRSFLHKNKSLRFYLCARNTR